MANKRLREQQNNQETTPAKKVSKSFIIKLVACIVAVVFFLVCIAVVINSYAPANPKDYHRWFLSGINGSYEKDGNPNKYWQVEKKMSGDKYLSTYAQIELVGSYTSVNEIWINLSDLYEDKLEIEIINASSRTINKVTITADEMKDSENGWFNLYDLDVAKESTTDNILEVNSRKFSIGFNTKINVREIVFVKDKNTDGKYEIINYNITAEKIENQVTDLDKITESETSIHNIKNEQTTFPNGFIKV